MTTTSNGSTNNLDLYSIVTNQVIDYIEQNKTVPWVKPWAEAGIPMNLISKRPYRGINLLLLAMMGFERNLFLTFDQLKAIGGSVRKGEHGVMIIYWKRKEENEVDEAEASAENHKPKKGSALLRYYRVFNVSQCENIPAHLLPNQPETLPEFDPILECEAIFHKMPKAPELVFKQQKAFYDFDKDFINMPKKKSFKTIESYYSTLFHETVHATGHVSRLNRATLMDMAEFGSSTYSQEELIAELGCCYLCHYAGILPQTFKNSAAYIEGWLKQLHDDKKFIVTASAQSQRAVDYVLNLNRTERVEVS